MTNKEAIEILCDQIKGNKSEAMQMALKALCEPQWIPCQERLPEQYGNYLISIDGEELDIGTINPYDHRGWSLCDANGFYWANDRALNITAWMPLPEPYREEGEK